MKVTAISSFDSRTKCLIPLMDSRVKAGFPSPADDFMDRAIDLNEELIAHPEATFFVRVSGDSMTGAGIFSGDTLIVDRAVEPTSGKVVVALLNGEFTAKRIVKQGEQVLLRAENEAYPDIVISEVDSFEVWGVVRHVIHSL